jgi:hypothetical protein
MGKTVSGWPICAFWFDSFQHERQDAKAVLLGYLAELREDRRPTTRPPPSLLWPGPPHRPPLAAWMRVRPSLPALDRAPGGTGKTLSPPPLALDWGRMSPHRQPNLGKEIVLGKWGNKDLWADMWDPCPHQHLGGVGVLFLVPIRL